MWQSFTALDLRERMAKEKEKAQLTQELHAVPRWLSAAILDIIEPEIAPFDPPTPKTLA